MKSLKINFAMMAVVLGVGFAFTSNAKVSHSKFTTYTYGRLSDGTWVATDPSVYKCDASSQICEGKFSYQNPPQNATPDQGILVNDGTYTLR